MIKNLWKKIVLVCGNCHNEKIVMQLIQGPSSLFYACPKYHQQNRTKGELACPNRINLMDYEKMIDYFSARMEEALIMGYKENLTNVTWQYKKTITFKVLSHTEEELKISMYNKKAFK